MVLLMMRTRSLLGPVVKQTTTKPATVVRPTGAHSAGNHIVYKANNP